MEETVVGLHETKFTVTVQCKGTLSEADLQFLEADINRRLYAALVQKIADIEFKRG